MPGGIQYSGQAGGGYPVPRLNSVCLHSLTFACFIPLERNCDCDFDFDNDDGYLLHLSTYRHPGCICPPLYEGPHCEFLVSKLGSASRGGNQGIDDGDGSSMKGLAALALFIVATFTVLAVFAGRRVGKGLKRSSSKKKEPAVNLQTSFRDENFGALSPNGNTLFPAFSMDIVEGSRARDAHLYDVEFT
jgi:hypothetical protein